MNEYGSMGNTEVLEEKYFPVRLCPRQVPHGLLWERDQASHVGDRKLAARAVAWQTLH